MYQKRPKSEASFHAICRCLRRSWIARFINLGKKRYGPLYDIFLFGAHAKKVYLLTNP